MYYGCRGTSTALHRTQHRGQGDPPEHPYYVAPWRWYHRARRRQCVPPCFRRLCFLSIPPVTAPEHQEHIRLPPDLRSPTANGSSLLRSAPSIPGRLLGLAFAVADHFAALFHGTLDDNPRTDCVLHVLCTGRN